MIRIPDSVALVRGALLVAAAALAAAPSVPAQEGDPAGGKIPVRTAADLPVHEYSIEGKASDFLLSDAPFRAFVSEVKTNVETDLARYDIQDKTTLQMYENLRMQIAMLEGRFEDVPAIVERIRDLETKESKRLVTGQTALSLVEARKAAGATSGPEFEAAFKACLAARVSSLPWEQVAEEIKQARGRAQILKRDLVLGQMKAMLDPVVAQAGGKLSSELAHGLVGARAALDHLLPLQPMVADVYGSIIDARAGTTPKADRWTPMQVALTGREGGSPVLVAVWDSGVDTAIYEKSLWTNPEERPNGKDDDGNGFVDDLHGIAFDLEGRPTPDLLLSIEPMRNDSEVVMKHLKGMGDLQSAIESPEAAELRAAIASLGQDEVGTFLEDLALGANFSHGTHVAGIALAGNPYAKLLVARIEFDHELIPRITPSVEEARKMAAAAKRTVDYFRAAGVRVVNMSWGGGVKEIEQQLEQKGVGATPEERNAMAREIFAIGRDGLDEAIRSAPEILFIAAAGNSDNDNEFAEMIPSALSAPNLVTVGAVDATLKPTSFTTFGNNVRLYANGFEVESHVPGGERIPFSGTSMAAPNVANLAAKILALAPERTVAEVLETITKGADPMEGYPGRLVIDPASTLRPLLAND